MWLKEFITIFGVLIILNFFKLMISVIHIESYERNSKEFSEICKKSKSIKMAENFQTLGEFIIDKQEDFQYSTGELSRLLSAIRLASKVVNREVNKAGIANIIGKAGNENIQGE